MINVTTGFHSKKAARANQHQHVCVLRKTTVFRLQKFDHCITPVLCRCSPMWLCIYLRHNESNQVISETTVYRSQAANNRWIVIEGILVEVAPIINSLHTRCPALFKRSNYSPERQRPSLICFGRHSSVSTTCGPRGHPEQWRRTPHRQCPKYCSLCHVRPLRAAMIPVTFRQSHPSPSS
jgi:hypothetical protein